MSCSFGEHAGRAWLLFGSRSALTSYAIRVCWFRLGLFVSAHRSRMLQKSTDPRAR